MVASLKYSECPPIPVSLRRKLMLLKEVSLLHADVRLFRELALHADHADHGMVALVGVFGVGCLPRSPIVGTAQTAKRDRQHRGEALGRDPAFGVPERVKAEVVILRFAFGGVGLHAEWIDEE